MKGLLADVNVEGHFQRLLRLLNEESRREFWLHLNLATPSFDDLGLPLTATDLVVWEKCQAEQLVLITANRNDEGPDSLESTIRIHNTLESLPAITLGDADRFLADREYAERAADQLLEDLFDIENYRGAGRIYVP